jgi:hypothetical protein
MSPHLVLRPITHGYYRVYWTGGGEPAYIHEAWKWMPYKGYELEGKDIELISKKYFEEYEDQLTMNRKVKNFVEGYWDCLDRVKTRLYMLKNNKEFRQEATRAYRQVVVK